MDVKTFADVVPEKKSFNVDAKVPFAELVDKSFVVLDFEFYPSKFEDYSMYRWGWMMFLDSVSGIHVTPPYLAQRRARGSQRMLLLPNMIRSATSIAGESD